MFNKLDKIYSKYKINYSQIGCASSVNQFENSLNEDIEINNNLIDLFIALLKIIRNDIELILNTPTPTQNQHFIKERFENIIKYYKGFIENILSNPDIKNVVDLKKFYNLIKFYDWGKYKIEFFKILFDKDIKFLTYYAKIYADSRLCFYNKIFGIS